MPFGAAVFFARNGGGADVADCGYCGREAAEHFFNFRDFVLLSGPRGGLLKSTVDKIRQESPFFVYFEVRASRIWSRR